MKLKGKSKQKRKGKGSGELLINGKLRFVSMRSGGLPIFGKKGTKIHKFGVSGGLLKNGGTKIRSVGFRKMKTQRFTIGWVLSSEEQKTKIRSDRVGFRPLGKKEPEFVQVGF
ncbi:unnamed protein product [Rhizophagus irregularis]|nr:unnamed protein product [Rhizophagus irregularis]